MRRWDERVPTYDVMNTYPSDYKVIFVGDAAMSPYEIMMPGGSVEHWNEEAGLVWLQRMLDVYKHAVWLNPTTERYWDSTPSTKLIQQIMGNRMYPLTLDGIDAAITELIERYWESTPSCKLIRQIVGNRMYPLTLDGIDAAITELMR